MSGADIPSSLVSAPDSGPTSAPGAWAAGRAWLERNRFLVVFALLASLMGVSVGMAQVATSLYAVHLGSSYTQLGLIAGAQSIGVLLMSLPVGMLVDRFGPARPFIVGTLVVGSIYTLVPWGSSPSWLFACTAAVSFFMPLRFVSLNTLFLQQLASLGESKAGWYRGTHMLGMFLVGPLVGAALVSEVGFAWAYRSIAALFFVTILVSPIVLVRYAQRPAASSGPSRRELWAQLKLILGDREVRRLSLLESLTQATGAYFTFFIVVFALKVAGLGASEASSLISAKGITYIIALFVLGGFVQRLGPRRATLSSFVVLALSLAVLGVSHRAGGLWLGSLGLGLGLGTIQIATLTRYAQVGARTGHGKASGLNSLAGPAGWMLGSLAGGVLGKWVGLDTVFLLLGASFGLAALALGVARTGAPAVAAPSSSPGE